MTDSTADPSDERASVDRDVVVVGCGPAGGSAAVFAAREGLDTVVFDRGTGSLDRCAFLRNYLGFPAGIGVETFQERVRDHAREAGAEVVDDLVESVARSSSGGGDGPTDESERSTDERDESTDALVVETQDGRRVRTRYVVAATRYDGSYLRPLDDADEMFQTHEHGGEARERFDTEYAADDGRTPVSGLYVASPAGERDVQAIVAAGRGAHVARSLLEDHRATTGFPGNLAKRYDWVRPDTEFEGEWNDRDRWREAIEARTPDDHGLVDAEFDALVERAVDDAFATRTSDEAVDAATESAQRRLLEYVDDAVIRDYLDESGSASGSDEGARQRNGEGGVRPTGGESGN